MDITLRGLLRRTMTASNAPWNAGSTESELVKERTFGRYGLDVERDICRIDLNGIGER